MKVVFAGFGLGILLHLGWVLFIPAANAAEEHSSNNSEASAVTTEGAWPVKLKVFSSRENRTIDFKDLVKELSNAPLVLLGEVHDNPDHHRLRAILVSQLSLARVKREPSAAPSAAVFEHATTERQPQLDRLTARVTSSTRENTESLNAHAEDFFKASNWTLRGWPEANLFAPLVRAVLGARMPLFAGDVPRQRIMSVARGSSTPQSEALSEAEIARLKLDRSLGPENNNASLTEIAAAHCGVMPESMLGPMAYAQRVRDATLADVMLKAAQQHGSAVLFAGNGHVRTDRGVPWYLRARSKHRVLSVMFQERAPGANAGPRQKPGPKAGEKEGLASTAQRDATSAADYMVWTAPRERPDPCEKLREKYGKTKR